MSEPLRKDQFYDERLKGAMGSVRLYAKNPGLGKILPSFDVSGSEASQWMMDGDIAYSYGDGRFRIMLSRTANTNTLLVTEQCDNACQFCSQPPKPQEDSILFAFAAQSLIEFAAEDFVGISGGEPFLFRTRALDFFGAINAGRCFTPLHILTNGRALSDISFARQLVKINEGRELILGIPLYAGVSSVHDSLVGCSGAWQETIQGIMNAVNLGFSVELRIIPTKLNIHQLYHTAKIILDCVHKLTSVSIMNLEPTGWARKNWDNLYLSPADYHSELRHVCELSTVHDVPVNLFNYPLCHLPADLRRYAVKSISDWKNVYLTSCSTCELKGNCGGFFKSVQNIEMDTNEVIYEEA